MIAALILTLALGAAAPGAQGWSCRNSVEVWCDADACTARPQAEMTPLSVHVEANGKFSACAYSGCWTGRGEIVRRSGRLLLTAEKVPFSSGSGRSSTDVTVLILESDGTGFLRAGGLATPLHCRRTEG